jgi:hypothetical protein
VATPQKELKFEEVKENALTQMEAELAPAAENIKHDVLDVSFIDITVVQTGLNFRFLHT